MPRKKKPGPATNTSATTPPTVAILSLNEDTRRGLQRYLARSQIEAFCLEDLEAPGEFPPGLRILILFPDDFDGLAVGAWIASLQTRPLCPTLLLISSAPQRIQPPAPRTAELLPRPAFGWVIVDFIRARIPEPRR